ncbi:hypothetical protein GNP84_18780 [Aliivibrio fischeri]|uniref:hypothetical protein n=1 Tax=Aliivibrio fischeri TaxID=668 RepID=UPI0012D8C910|nr:hypothetical protein [Aliivibrio fischeri]MUK78928.1 hypothetical protein [Aliivibrio fischeri]
MKIKTYNSKKTEIKIEDAKLSMTETQVKSAEFDFSSNTIGKKNYCQLPAARKKKWLKLPSSDTVLSILVPILFSVGMALLGS